MTTLYVSDLDGTLLNPQSKVSDTSAELISSLSRDGALITVATARTPATVVPLLANVYTRVPAIVMTGAAMWSRTEERFISTAFLPQHDTILVTDVMARHGITPFYYTLPASQHAGRAALNVYHSGETLTLTEQKFINERIDKPLKHFYLHTNVPENCRSKTILIFGLAPIESVKAAAAELQNSTQCYVSSYPDIFNPEQGLIEVYAPGVSKASAVRRLAHECGADRIVAFGDNLNDLPMLAVADVAVAVGNALSAVREAANVVIGPNTDDSVARFIADDYHRQTNATFLPPKS